jgi:hypothetical protein
MNNHMLEQLSSAERLEALMEGLGFKKYSSPAVLVAALALHEGRFPRADLMKKVHDFFSQRAVFIPLGLEELPSVWLNGLAEILWSTRKPEWEVLPYFISAIGIENGILRIAYRQEQRVLGARITSWDQLRIVINLSLQPNFWRPLCQEEEREIWDKRPNLRRELLAVG